MVTARAMRGWIVAVLMAGLLPAACGGGGGAGGAADALEDGQAAGEADGGPGGGGPGAGDGGALDGATDQIAVLASAVKVTGLRTEYLTDPLGIDTVNPRLSWELESTDRAQRQTAYEIVVTSASDGASLWATGKVASAQQAHVSYRGTALVSGQSVRWKVRIWDGQDRVSAFSSEAAWEMGLLGASDWKGKWIGATTALVVPPPPSPFLRRAFMVGKPVRAARAYVAGLGYAELHLNGQKLGDHVLDPGFTRFDRRVLYVVHDITKALQVGKNAVGAVLGNGFYNQHARDAWDFTTASWRGTPRLLLQIQITYEDGTTETVVSDESWKVAQGPILFDGIRNGEYYDARQEKAGWAAADYVEDASWTPALVQPAPGGVLSAQMLAPQKVMRSLPPKAITEPAPGVFLVDFGENLAGWVRLTVTGPAGTQVQMRYGEKLATDGRLDQSNIAFLTFEEEFQTDRYTLKGQGSEVWEPRFTYHGFQYAEVTGFPGRPTAANFQAQVVHTAFEQVGHFSSSNDLLNKIYDATLRSYRANFQSIPTDCPHREKLGWMADGHLGAEQAMFNFGNAAGYTKWVRDMRDEMRPTGELPGIVPTGGWGYTWGNGPAWDSALFLVPWYLYQYLGDEQILTGSYDHFKRYVDYVGTRTYMTANPMGWLGDWVAPMDAQTPEAVTHAGYHAADARITAATARLLGKTDEATKYDQVAAGVKTAFRAAFFNATTAQVAGDQQTALGGALAQGLLEDADRPRVLDRLLASIAAHGNHIYSGVLGAKYLPVVLTESGHADLVYTMATKTDYPSWGYWIQMGSTTLWETWGIVEDASRNHVFFGDIVTWFFRALAGINPDPAGPGFAQIIFRPQVVGDLSSARADTHSLRGTIASEWKRAAGVLTFDFTVPVNSRATVFLPAPARDKVVAPDGAAFVRAEGDRQVYSVESGRYVFEVH
jgi:alpha-L-rhamnosidase